jgi:hypothetical protein
MSKSIESMGMKGVLVVLVPNFVANIVVDNDMDFFYYRKIWLDL